MVTTHHRTQSERGGFALVVAILISSVVLAVGLSMLNITLKQYLFSGIGRESEIAFYAADAGMECGLYWDTSLASAVGVFDIGSGAQTISCMGQNVSVSGSISEDPIEFQFDWQESGQAVCTKVAVTKFAGPDAPSGYTCDSGAVCTQVESRGYNRPCNQLDSPRVVERALRANY
jgi:Tfp pilus assembly protein PilX